jgi:hypothetical protein
MEIRIYCEVTIQVTDQNFMLHVCVTKQTFSFVFLSFFSSFSSSQEKYPALVVRRA